MKINDYKTEELVGKLNEGLALGKSGVAVCKELGLARSSVLTRIKRDGYIHDKNTNQYLKEEDMKAAEAPKKVVKEKVKKAVSKDIKEKTKKAESKKVKETAKKTENKDAKKKDIIIGEIKEEKKISEQNMPEEAYEGEWKVEEAIAKLRNELKNKKNGQDKKIIEKDKEKIKKINENKKADDKISEQENNKINKNKEIKEIIEEIKEVKNEKVEEKQESKIVKEELVDKKELEELRKMIQQMNERLEVVEKKKDVEKNISIKNTKETTTRSIRLYKEVNEKLNKYLKKNKEKKVIDIISLALLEYMEK